MTLLLHHTLVVHTKPCLIYGVSVPALYAPLD